MWPTVLRRSQDRGSSRQLVVTMLTPSRGASAETPGRHPALRGHSIVTPRQMSGGGKSHAIVYSNTVLRDDEDKCIALLVAVDRTTGKKTSEVITGHA